MEIFKHLGVGEFPSSSEYNRLLDAVAGLLGSTNVQYFADSKGVHVRRMPIDSGGGHILMRHIGAETIPHNVATLIPINDVISDPDGWYDSTNFGLIAPSNGIYFTSSKFTVTWTPHTDIRAEVSVRKNGGFEMDSTKSHTPTIAGSAISWSTYGMMELNKNDLIQFFFWHYAGAAQTMEVDSGGHAGMWLLR